MHSVRKVLVADTPEGFEAINAIVGDHVALAHVPSFDEALEMLSWQPDMVICGMHFDESRMFDLLRAVMSNRHFKGKPVICYRNFDSALPDTLFESLEIACRVLGPARFVDLYQLKTMHGLRHADKLFRDIIMACLA